MNDSDEKYKLEQRYELRIKDLKKQHFLEIKDLKQKFLNEIKMQKEIHKKLNDFNMNEICNLKNKLNFYSDDLNNELFKNSKHNK
tara:strand:- start:181 stop:435 length:255 start_codon:yes stop_codon:yes gene_type:complete